MWVHPGTLENPRKLSLCTEVESGHSIQRLIACDLIHGLPSQMAKNIWPKRGPHWQFSLAHIWPWLAVLTQVESDCLNSATHPSDMVQICICFGPLDPHLALTTFAVTHVRAAYSHMAASGPSNMCHNPSLVQLRAFGSHLFNTCQCYNWATCAIRSPY